MQDAANRRAKQLWLACQNVLTAVVEGRSGVDGDRAPLANQLIAIREAAGDDPVVASLFNAFPDEALAKGVYADAALKKRFDKVTAFYCSAQATQVLRVCRRVALVNDADNSMSAFAVSFLQSLLVMRQSHVPYAVDESLDRLHPPSTFAILDRAQHHLCVRNDLESTIK